MIDFYAKSLGHLHWGKAEILEQYFHFSLCMSMSSIHGAGSSIYSGVGGGCTLTSLTNFSERQEKTALTKMSSEKVKGMDFYKDMFRRWYWMKSLEEQVKRKKIIKSRAAAVLKMTGVSSVVYGQEMPQKQERHRADVYQRRANSQHGYHNPSVIMDSCLGDSL